MPSRGRISSQRTSRRSSSHSRRRSSFKRPATRRARSQSTFRANSRPIGHRATRRPMRFGQRYYGQRRLRGGWALGCIIIVAVLFILIMAFVLAVFILVN